MVSVSLVQVEGHCVNLGILNVRDISGASSISLGSLTTRCDF